MISNLLLTGNFAIDLVKNILFAIDKAIYGLVGTAYRVFYYLANATLVENINGIMTRMYAILGIVMVFVLAFNLLTYIVDPDKINDKKTGASTFVKDVILAIIIISITPMLFTKLYALQSQIIVSGVIDNLILGGSGSAPDYEEYDSSNPNYSSLSDYYIQNGANSMVASVYVAFLYPKDNFAALECKESDNGEHEDYCRAYKEARKTGDINAFSDLITNDDYNFSMFITTVAGVVLLFFIFSFCLNLAKRVGKMAIIQLIAPIPVTLELLPNKKGLRQNWLKTLVSVYLEVFFFLLVIYIVIFLISLVPDVVKNLFMTAPGASGPIKLLTTVFLIFGLLFFGKEAPQMIFDLLGIKSTGVISAAAKRAVAMASVTANTAGSMASNMVKNAANTEGGVFARGASALAGGFSAGARNVWAGRNAHNWRDAANNRTRINGTVQQNRRNRTDYRNQHGGTLTGAMAGHVSDFRANISEGASAFIHGRYDESNQTISLLDRLSSATSEAKLKKNEDASYRSAKEMYDQHKNANFQGFMNDYNAWKATVTDGKDKETDFMDYLSTHGGTYAGHSYSDMLNSHLQMKQAEKEMINRNDEKLRVAAANAMAIINANPSLQNLKGKVTINGVSSSMSLSDALKQVVTDTGELKSGMFNADLQSVIDAYNKAISEEKTRLTAESAQRRYRDEERRNRRGGGSSSGGSGS